MLLDNGADPNSMHRLDSSDGYDYSGAGYTERTALQYASMRGDIALARIFLEKGADINAKDNVYKTALHLAVESGSKNMVIFLLENDNINVDGDGNLGREEGRTPLHIAVHRGYFDIAQLLLKRGANVNAPHVFLAYHKSGWGAIYQYSYSISFLQATPLHLAMGILDGFDDSPRQNQDDCNMAQLLLCHGANIDAEAVEKTEHLFEDDDKDDQIKTTSGITPLRVAIRNNYKGKVQFLLQNGAKRDQEALELARRLKHDEIVQMLEENINTIHRYGQWKIFVMNVRLVSYMYT